MLETQDLRLDDAPGAFKEAVRDCAFGRAPANIGAMRLLMEARAVGEAERALCAVLAELDSRLQAAEITRLKSVLDLLCANPQAYGTVKAVLDDVSHDATSVDPDAAIRHLALAFDRAAQVSPEGSVALYALGNPDLLRAATGEVVDRMRDWGLLGRERSVLDLGCGIGRFEVALAAEVRSIVGIDISGEMIAAARSRCAGLGNVSFLHSSGRDLSPFAASTVDLVLAVDSFPYLMQAGMSLVQTHIAEAARVLKPQGDLFILNFSYRGDADRDRADLRRVGEAHGLAVLRDGLEPFSLWDGLAFHLSKGP